MPARRPTDAPSDSRRSSLRRLSSIASFQAFFTRRRSNNTTEHTNSSSSNLSYASNTATNHLESGRFGISESTTEEYEDTIQELPHPPLPSYLPSRRGSYICLPDDPIGGMPRSRTFSNLPLPTRVKKTAMLVPSVSHTRLPSGGLSSTRLPTPPVSTRKYSYSRLACPDDPLPPPRNRLQRSDTEPLLKASIDQMAIPRSTAFKENISLSPIRPLPAMEAIHHRDPYGSSLPTRSHRPKHRRADSYNDGEPLLPEIQRRGQAAAISLSMQHKSSPAYRGLRDRVPTPVASGGVPVQRWNSQPTLINATNVHLGSQHREIKQTRLLSARPAPTPPPSNAMTFRAVTTSKLNLNNAGHIREVSESSPIPPQTTPVYTPSSPPRPQTGAQTSAADSDDSPPTNAGLVTTAEPPAYWCGRLSALVDRLRNEEFRAHLADPKFTPSKAQTDKMHNPEANMARIRKALQHLHDLCATDEAKHSLAVFQLQYASMMKCPDLSKPIVLNSPKSKSDAGKEYSGDGSSMSEGRKISFMDRLLGKQKRKSLVPS